MQLIAIVKSLLKNTAPYGVVTGFERRRQISDTSFANEEATLDKLAREIGLAPPLGSPERGWVVDIGASDGVAQSSTKKFAYEYGWNGCMIECDSLKFSALSSLYSRHDRVSLVKSKVNPFNIVSMLRGCDVPLSFSILNLDIDSWDLSVIEALLSSGYEPSLITMEINEIIPESIFFSVRYNPDHAWKSDHFYGCSLAAASRVIKQFGYSLAAVEWNNAFFVKQNSGKSISDLSVAEAFRVGYSSREDRLTVFPWNSDVDHWHSLRSAEAMNEIKKYFSDYDQSLYDLRIDPA
jgi:hypothetical protein